MSRFVALSLLIAAGLCAAQGAKPSQKEPKEALQDSVQQLKLLVTVKDPGERSSFVAWATSSHQSCYPVRFTSGSTTLVMEKPHKERVTVFVTDEKAQKTAARVLSKFDPGASLVEFAKPDFTIFRRVTLDFGSLPGGKVEISQKDNPLLPEGKPLTLSLSPSDGGKLAVNDTLVAGSFKVRLEYGDGKEKSETFEIQSDATPDALTFAMIPEGFALPKKPEVGGVETGKDETSGSKSEPGSDRPSGSGFLGALLGSAVVVAAVYFGYKYLKQRGITLDSALGRLRVQLPDPNSPQQACISPTPAAQPPLVPEGHCPFCGRPKDAAGNCGCQVGTAMAGVGTLAPGGSPKLIGLGGNVLSQIFPITGEITIGREPANVIALTQDTTASRHHACITCLGGCTTIKDLGSSNGTFVNGQRVTERQLLPGDEIVIGSTRFRFDIS